MSIHCGDISDAQRTHPLWRVRREDRGSIGRPHILFRVSLLNESRAEVTLHCESEVIQGDSQLLAISSSGTYIRVGSSEEATMSISDDRDGFLVLETINESDMTEEDLVELGEALRNVSDVPIAIAYEDQFGAGVTWHEVLDIWLPAREFFTDKAWDVMLGIIFENLRRRFSRKGYERRPKTLRVRDPQTGEVLAHYIIEELDSEPKLEEPDQSPRRRPRLRKRID